MRRHVARCWIGFMPSTVIMSLINFFFSCRSRNCELQKRNKANKTHTHWNTCSANRLFLLRLTQRFCHFVDFQEYFALCIFLSSFAPRANIFFPLKCYFDSRYAIFPIAIWYSSIESAFCRGTPLVPFKCFLCLTLAANEHDISPLRVILMFFFFNKICNDLSNFKWKERKRNDNNTMERTTKKIHQMKMCGGGKVCGRNRKFNREKKHKWICTRCVTIRVYALFNS